MHEQVYDPFVLRQVARSEQSLYSALEHSSKSSMDTRETMTSEPSSKSVFFKVDSSERMLSKSSFPLELSSRTSTNSLIFMLSVESRSAASFSRAKFLFVLLLTLMEVTSELWYRSWNIGALMRSSRTAVSADCTTKRSSGSC